MSKLSDWWFEFRIKYMLRPVAIFFCFIDNLLAKRGLKESIDRTKRGYWGGMQR